MKDRGLDGCRQHANCRRDRDELETIAREHLANQSRERREQTAD